MSIKARVLEKSVNAEGNELITFEIELHRFILPEFNTHRMFSRNFQSSRAVPTMKQIKLILQDPALPVYWGSNNPGMSSNARLGKFKSSIANGFRRFASYLAIGCSLFESKVLGVHKQWANRYLEPFMYTKGVITTNKEGLANFFALRRAPDAQPEIKALADEMYKAYLYAPTTKLKEGGWHLPYVTEEERNTLPIEKQIEISISKCASVSYRPDSVNVERVWSRLGLDGTSENVHASPAEHQAQAKKDSNLTGNLGIGWRQYRKIIPNEFKRTL